MVFEQNGLRMEYEVRGEGLPLLALHGWGVDRRLMSGCLEPVWAHGGAGIPRCARYYPDLPGMGLSPGSDRINGADDMLDAVTEFVEGVLPKGPFLLAGESYGGYLSRGLLRKMPGRIAGLLLIAPSYRPWRKTESGTDKGDVPEHRVIARDDAFLSGLTEEELSAFREMGVMLTEDAWNRFSRDVWPGIRVADRKFLGERLSRNIAFREDPDSGGTPFEKPALFVTARQDASVGYRDIWTLIERFPRATFCVLDGAGHNLQTERVPLFEALVTDWLDRVKDTAMTDR